MHPDIPLNVEPRTTAPGPSPSPPPLAFPGAPDAGRRSDRWLPLWLFAGTMTLIAGLRLAGAWHVPMPRCWLRQFTGIPCPSCGCTRSLLAWSNFDLAQALRFNPLFFICCVVGVFWFGLWSSRQLFGWPWLNHLQFHPERWPVGRIFVLLVALNWLYLCLKLPK
jgi:Protein of unknown function (DUF2752)